MQLFVLSSLLAAASAAPGGYTGYGGVYKDMNQKAGYTRPAKKAKTRPDRGQLALNQDELLVNYQAVRPAGKRYTHCHTPSMLSS